MKKDARTVEDMVMRAHYLEALDMESRAGESLSDMERKEFIDTIKSLKETIESLKTSMEAMKESYSDNTETLRQTIKDLHQKIDGLTSQLEAVTKERDDLRAMLSRSSQERFGSKSLKKSSRKVSGNSKPDREQEKDDFASKTEDEENGNTPQAPTAGEGIDQTKVKSESLDGERAKRGKYSRMDAAQVIRLDTTLEGIPSGMKLIGYKEYEEYTKKSYVECTVFKVAILEDEYGTRHEYYKPQDPEDKRKPAANTIPGTHCTPELLADLAIERYMMFVPVYRESIRHTLDRFQVSRNTDSNWLRIGARMLSPVTHLLRERLLKIKSILNIDETYALVRIKFKGDGTKLGRYFKKYVWIIVNKKENISYFLYDNDENDSRGLRPIQSFLGDFLGTIQSDGYNVYKHLAGDNPENEHLMCWAHVHNKFEQVFKACKDKHAEWFSTTIGELYRIEAECIEANMTPEQIKERRDRKDVENILKRLYQKGSDLLNQKRRHYSEMMRKALRYMIDNWKDLVKYRNDGRYTIDNMLAERSIRPFTVGRKNSLFFSSEEGLETACTYHTIIETCKNLGLNVRDYLVRVFREIMEGNKAYDTLIPGAVALG